MKKSMLLFVFVLSMVFAASAAVQTPVKKQTEKTTQSSLKTTPVAAKSTSTTAKAEDAKKDKKVTPKKGVEKQKTNAEKSIK